MKTMDGITRKKAMRFVIMAQSAGMLATILFDNGFMLAYLSKIGICSADVLMFLSLPSLIIFVFLVPAAHMADVFGKKMIGSIGLVGTIIGFAVISATGIFSFQAAISTVFFGILLFSIGYAMFVSGWFALLDPIVPVEFRGRFFGNLRLSWHITGVIFTLVVTAFLKIYSSISVYQIIMVGVTILLFARLFFYVKLPEIDKHRPLPDSFGKSIAKAMAIPGYLPFCAYTFFIMFFTGACPWIFSLLEKDVLKFTEYQIVLLGNLLFVGSIIGFYFGGKVIDRYGTKTIFLICHMGFGAILVLFVLRNVFSTSLLVSVGILTILFGIVRAMSGIAITTEMMSLISKENKSLSTSLNFMMYSGGITLSGMLSGKIIDLKLLSKSWIFFGLKMSEYDTLLLFCAMMIFLSVILLGLVPSVLQNKQIETHYIPQGTR